MFSLSSSVVASGFPLLPCSHTLFGFSHCWQNKYQFSRFIIVFIVFVMMCVNISQPTLALLSVVVFYHLNVGVSDSWLLMERSPNKEVAQTSSHWHVKLNFDSRRTKVFILSCRRCLQISGVTHTQDNMKWTESLETHRSLSQHFTVLLVGSQRDLNNTNLSLPVVNKEQCEWDFIDRVLSKAECCPSPVMTGCL